MTEADMPPEPAVRPGRRLRAAFREFWYYFSVNKGAVIGLCGLRHHDPRRDLRAAARAAMIRSRSTPTPSSCRPSWQEGGPPRFLLGTDDVGRDMLSRLIYGARYSLAIGLVVVTIAMVTGVTLGRDRRLLPRLGRRADHAGDGHHPRLPLAAAGAGAGLDPRQGPVQRHARHRAGAAAALRAPRPRRGDEREDPRIRDLGQGRRRRPLAG